MFLVVSNGYMYLKEFGQCLRLAENAFEADENEPVSRAHVGILLSVLFG